jgi:hypothetical protein
MRRRTFLSAVGATGTVAVSGCSSLSSEPVSLGSPTVENPDEGVYFYDFDHNGDPAANVDVQIEPRSTPAEQAGVVLSVGPQAEWTCTMIEFALRVPTDSMPGEPSARFQLAVADAASYPLSFRLTDRGYRVLELEGLEDAGLGTSTIPLQLEVVPLTAAESLSLRSTTRWRSPEGRLMEATFTDRLVMPITR